MENIIFCPAHRIQFNERLGCPNCAEDRRIASLPELPKESRKGMYIYRCPFCGSKSIRPESCSRYACGKKAGLYRPILFLKRCANCRGKTKYDRYCTKYPCRQKAGTVSMYNRSC